MADGREVAVHRLSTGRGPLQSVGLAVPQEIAKFVRDVSECESIWTTAVTVFEIRFGIELLPASRRRRQLEDAFARAVDEDFQGRVLPFDQSEAPGSSPGATTR